MKVEFLKGLGIDDELIAKIQAESGKDITAEKEKLNELKAKYDELISDKEKLETKIGKLSESSKNADEYKEQLETLKSEISAKEEAQKKEAEEKELTEAIVSVFGDKKFTSDYVRNGIIADMKAEIQKPENKGKGYAELFQTLTKDKEGIFKNPNPPADMTGMGDVDTKKIDDSQVRAVMGLPQK